MQRKTNALATLRSLMTFLGFYNPMVDKGGRKLRLTVWFYFVNVVLTTMSVQCIIQLVLDKNRDIGQMCYVISMSGVIFGASFQSMYVFFRKGQILKLFELIEANFEYSSQTGLQEIDMEGYIKKGMLLIYWWCLVLVLAVVCLVGSPLSVTDQRVLPLPTWYPYDWKVNPAFEWSFIVQTIALCLTDLCYLPTEVIFPYISLITTGQFKILGHNFRNIVYTALLNYGVSKKTVRNFKKSFNENFCNLNRSEQQIIDEVLQKNDFKILLNNLLNRYIMQHAALLEVSQRIEDTFSPFMLVKIFFNRMYIMMDILCVLYSVNMTYSVPIAVVGCCAFTQLVFFTIFGQIIQTESAQILEKMYECPWYLCSQTFKQTFLFAQMRARKIVIVTAGKFVTLNNESFLVFMNVVFSYVALFRQIMEK